MLKTKCIIILSGVCVVGAAIGGVAGWFVGSLVKPATVVTGSYERDEDAWNSFTKVVKDRNYSDIDFTTEDINIGDLVGSVFYKFAYVDTEARSFIGFNKAASSAAMVTNEQVTYSSFYVNAHDLRMKENISLSNTKLVSFGERTYNFDDSLGDGIATNQLQITSKDGNKLDAYQYFRVNTQDKVSDINDYLTADFKNGNKSNIPIKNYIESLSTTLYYPFNYVLKEKNVANTSTIKDLENKDVVFDNSINLKDDVYTATISINTDSTVSNAIESYQKYMKTTTRDASSDIPKMKDIPIFTQVGLKVKFSKDLKLIGMETLEKYAVPSIAGNVATTAAGKVMFNYLPSNIPLVKNEDTVDYSPVKVFKL